MYKVYFSKNNRQIFLKKYDEFAQEITQLEQLQKNKFKTFLQII